MLVRGINAATTNTMTSGIVQMGTRAVPMMMCGLVWNVLMDSHASKRNTHKLRCVRSNLVCAAHRRNNYHTWRP